MDESGPTKTPPTPATTAVSRHGDFPLRCQIDQTDTDGNPVKEMLNYMVISGSTRMANLLYTLLRDTFRESAEFSEDQIRTMLPNCKGFIEITHWAPIPLEQCCREPEIRTVSEMLENIRSKNLLIRIVLPSAEVKVISETLMRAQLKAMLFSQPGFSPKALCLQLQRCGCPLNEECILGFLTSPENYTFTLEQRQQFQVWHKNFMSQFLRAAAAASAAAVSASGPLPLQIASATSAMSDTSTSTVSSPIMPAHVHPIHPHPADPMAARASLASITARAPRIRTSFDSERELPLLQKWFQVNPHPSRQDMEHYRNVLNSQASRITRRPLDLTNIIYWFKNMRASVRRRREGEPSGFVMASNVQEPEEVDLLDEDEDDIDEETATNLVIKEEQTDCKTSNGDVKSEVLQDEQIVRVGKRPADDEDDEQQRCKKRHKEQLEEQDGLRVPHRLEAEDTLVSKVTTSVPLQESNGVPATDNNMLSTWTSHLPFGVPPSYAQAFNGFFNLSMTQAAVAAAAAANASFANSVDSSGGLENQLQMKRSPDTSVTECCSLDTPSPGLHGSMHHKRKRTRVFIDPASEIPLLEQWFTEDTHPTAAQFEAYCDALNRGHFRLKQPKLEPKNIQLWFKNHRAKIKRIKIEQGLIDACEDPNSPASSDAATSHSYQHSVDATASSFVQQQQQQHPHSSTSCSPDIHRSNSQLSLPVIPAASPSLSTSSL